MIRVLASRSTEMRKIVQLKSLEDTEKLATSIAKQLRGGDVLALSGQLGSGKTTFTQALGRALHAPREVKSPTFVVMHTHKLPKKMTLCHVDAYRIRDLEELDAIGLSDYLGASDTITVVEWAEKIKQHLPRHTKWIRFVFKNEKRTVTLTS